MKVLPRYEKLLRGAFLAVAILVSLAYLRVEHSWTYRIISLIFLGLVTWESIRLLTVTYAKLYILFLLACVGFYAFPHLHAIVFASGIFLGSLAILWSASSMETKNLGHREILALSVLFTLLVVTFADAIPYSLFSKAAVAMLATAGLAELFTYQSVERWRVVISYGILTLLLILLILTTAAIR